MKRIKWTRDRFHSACPLIGFVRRVKGGIGLAKASGRVWNWRERRVPRCKEREGACIGEWDVDGEKEGESSERKGE